MQSKIYNLDFDSAKQKSREILSTLYSELAVFEILIFEFIPKDTYLVENYFAGEIEFAGGVSEIGKQSLAEMTALRKIVFSGQTSDWLAVGKGEKWADKSSFTVECTNGSVSSAGDVL